MSKLLFRIFLTLIFTLNISDVYSMVQVKPKENNVVKKQESSSTKSYNIVESFKANKNLQNSNKAFKKIDKMKKNQKERIELFNYQIANRKQNLKYEDSLKIKAEDTFQKVESFQSNKISKKKYQFIEKK